MIRFVAEKKEKFFWNCLNGDHLEEQKKNRDQIIAEINNLSDTLKRTS